MPFIGYFNSYHTHHKGIKSAGKEVKKPDGIFTVSKALLINPAWIHGATEHGGPIPHSPPQQSLHYSTTPLIILIRKKKQPCSPAGGKKVFLI